jgi:hypothetical protein
VFKRRGKRKPRRSTNTAPQGASASLTGYVQGEVLQLARFTHLVPGPSEGAEVQAAASRVERLALLTQTCDIERAIAGDRSLQAAEVITAPDAAQAKRWSDGESPRHLALPLAGEMAFADLDRIVTLDPLVAVTCAHSQGVAPSDSRRFAHGVARKFERYPFPDDFSAAVGHLRVSILHKWDKDTSPEGRVLRFLSQLRVESSRGWDHEDGTATDVTLTFIMQQGYLPVLAEPAAPSVELTDWLSSERQASEVADRLERTTSASDRSVLLELLATAWASLCRPTGNFRSFVGEMVAEDEYPVSRYWKSEKLDLDHLSGPNAAT